MKKILNLTLKKEWFDMILSGEKKEEYREIKPYWVKRLIEPYDEMWPDIFDEMCNDLKDPLKHFDCTDCALTFFDCRFKYFDAVRFRNGYSKNAPEILIGCDGIQIGLGMTTWGAEPDTNYFIIQLGEIIKP